MLAEQSQDGLPDPDLDARFYDGVTLKRFWAWVIDFVITLVIGVLGGIAFGISTLGVGFLLFPTIVIIIGFAYRWITLTRNSATWGMALTGIEMRQANGERFDSLSAAIHTGLFSIAVISTIGQLISVVLMIGTSRGQGLHDLVMGSAAINRPAD